jgi:hypothetical protein
MGSLVSRVLAPMLARLGSRTIVAVGGTLFLLNMVIPDPIPLVDEFLILAGTILLSRWAQRAATGAEDLNSAPGAWSSPGSSRPAGEPKPVGRGSTHK